jgi:hypothetical protein
MVSLNLLHSMLTTIKSLWTNSMPEDLTLLKKELSTVTTDNVNHPKHYTSDPSGIECIQITRHRNFNIGNAIKYLWRAGLKDDANMSALEKQIEDNNKAIWYITDENKRLQELIVTPEPLRLCPVCNVQRIWNPIPTSWITCEEHVGKEICDLCKKTIYNSEPWLTIGYTSYHSVCKEKQRRGEKY